ncbi:MAG: hypothetical protein AAGF95_10160 [Chloroflexota bacterium]
MIGRHSTSKLISIVSLITLLFISSFGHLVSTSAAQERETSNFDIVTYDVEIQDIRGTTSVAELVLQLSATSDNTEARGFMTFTEGPETAQGVTLEVSGVEVRDLNTVILDLYGLRVNVGEEMVREVEGQMSSQDATLNGDFSGTYSGLGGIGSFNATVNSVKSATASNLSVVGTGINGDGDYRGELVLFRTPNEGTGNGVVREDVIGWFRLTAAPEEEQFGNASLEGLIFQVEGTIDIRDSDDLMALQMSAAIGGIPGERDDLPDIGTLIESFRINASGSAQTNVFEGNSGALGGLLGSINQADITISP